MSSSRTAAASGVTSGVCNSGSDGLGYQHLDVFTGRADGHCRQRRDLVGVRTAFVGRPVEAEGRVVARTDEAVVGGVRHEDAPLVGAHRGDRLYLSIEGVHEALDSAGGEALKAAGLDIGELCNRNPVAIDRHDRTTAAGALCEYLAKALHAEARAYSRCRGEPCRREEAAPLRHRHRWLVVLTPELAG